MREREVRAFDVVRWTRCGRGWMMTRARGWTDDGRAADGDARSGERLDGVDETRIRVMMMMRRRIRTMRRVIRTMKRSRMRRTRRDGRGRGRCRRIATTTRATTTRARTMILIYWP